MKLLLSTCMIFATAHAASAGATDLESFYVKQFALFPAWKTVSGVKGELQFTGNRKALKYRTTIRSEWLRAKEPNFSGHYFVPKEIGCGTGCLIFFAIEWTSGKIFSAPEDHWFEIHKESDLIVLKPYPECTAYGPPILYEFLDGRFRVVQHHECAK
jgi:hypothetical protein